MAPEKAYELLEELLRAGIDPETQGHQHWVERFSLDEEEVRDCLAAVALFDTVLLEDLPPAAAASAVPSLPPDYEVVELLGQGGMGVVYRVRQRSLDREVALKVLRPADAHFQSAVDRFRREAKNLATLRHRHIVSIHEVGKSDTSVYFTMDLISGETLSERIRKRPLSISEATRLCRQICSAVAYAHSKGLIHRDLKPSNILLDEDGDAHVVDFGLAFQADMSESATLTGQLLGTPRYMSPEQARGDRQLIGEATDVHAIGVMLYECLTQRPPYHGTSLLETLDAVIHQQPERCSRIRPEIPAQLETVCHRALAKEPQQRYTTVTALLNDLERFESGEPILGRRDPFWRKWARGINRNRKTTSALVAMLIVGSVAAMTLWTHERQRRAEELIALGDELRLQGEYEAGVRMYERARPLAAGLNEIDRLWLDGQELLQRAVRASQAGEPVESTVRKASERIEKIDVRQLSLIRRARLHADRDLLDLLLQPPGQGRLRRKMVLRVPGPAAEPLSFAAKADIILRGARLPHPYRRLYELQWLELLQASAPSGADLQLRSWLESLSQHEQARWIESYCRGRGDLLHSRNMGSLLFFGRDPALFALPGVMQGLEVVASDETHPLFVRCAAMGVIVEIEKLPYGFSRSGLLASDYNMTALTIERLLELRRRLPSNEMSLTRLTALARWCSEGLGGPDAYACSGWLLAHFGQGPWRETVEQGALVDSIHAAIATEDKPTSPSVDALLSLMPKVGWRDALRCHVLLRVLTDISVEDKPRFSDRGHHWSRDQKLAVLRGQWERALGRRPEKVRVRVVQLAPCADAMESEYEILWQTTFDVAVGGRAFLAATAPSSVQIQHQPIAKLSARGTRTPGLLGTLLRRRSGELREPEPKPFGFELTIAVGATNRGLRVHPDVGRIVPAVPGLGLAPALAFQAGQVGFAGSLLFVLEGADAAEDPWTMDHVRPAVIDGLRGELKAPSRSDFPLRGWLQLARPFAGWIDNEIRQELQESPRYQAKWKSRLICMPTRFRNS